MLLEMKRGSPVWFSPVCYNQNDDLGLWWAPSVLTEPGSRGEILNVPFDSMTKAFSEIPLNAALIPD